MRIGCQRADLKGPIRAWWISGRCRRLIENSRSADSDSALPSASLSQLCTIVCILSVTVCSAGDLRVFFVKLLYPSDWTHAELRSVTPACLELSRP